MEVCLHYRDRPGRTVAVRGDFSFWRVSHLLEEHVPGEYGCSMALVPGIYQYKLLLDRQHWIPDPNNPWTDHTEGFANSTLVVGGSQPPLFFAPCRRCWVLTAGRLTVHTEVEAGARIPAYLSLLAEDRSVVGSHPLRSAWCIANRVLLEYDGLVPAEAVRAVFDGYPGSWDLPVPTSETRPAWLEQGVIYSVFVDRWHRGSNSPPDVRAMPRDTPSTSDVIYGGDLYGVAESLDYIATLGVDAICLTPIHSAESAHRYDALSFDAVDHRLGGEAALKDLIDACHARGLRIVLDAAFTHCHRDHAAFQDLLQHQAQSPYRDWFHIKRFPVTPGDPSSYQHYPGHPELPLLDLGAVPVIDHFKQIIERWMQLRVDGLRFDAVEFGPAQTWRELGECARKHNPEVVVIAECVFESVFWAYEDLRAHAATDYTRYDLLLRTLALCSQPAAQTNRLERLYQHRLGPSLDQIGLRFVDTHDTDRFLTLAKNEPRLRAALAYLLLRSEPVLFYYGTEFALTSDCPTQRRDASWPDRMPMPELEVDSDVLRFVRYLLRKRRMLRRRGFGPARPLDAPDGIMAYERVSAAGSLRVLVNTTDQPQEIEAAAGDGIVVVNTASSMVPGVLPGCSAMAIAISLPQTGAR